MPARPAGSLLVLKVLVTLEGPGLFDRLDPSTDSQAFCSLRLTCAELRQLVDCFGTRSISIKLLDQDYPHTAHHPRTRSDYAQLHKAFVQLREAGAALGRYHARLTGPVPPRKLCINAKTCCPCPARGEHGHGVTNGDQMAVYMTGYKSVAGVPAVLAQVTECCLAGASGYGLAHSGMWYALVPHLTSLAYLGLCFHAEQGELPQGQFLAMAAWMLLPPSAQLRTLAVEEGAHVDREEGFTRCLRCAAEVLKEHPIQELHLLLHGRLPGALLLHTLSDALPSLERLRVTQLKPDLDDGMPATRFSWLLPGNTFTALRSINYQPYGDAKHPLMLLTHLDDLLRDRPRLLHVGALRMVMTPDCLARQARYEHVERAQSASAAGGGLGQLSFILHLGDGKAAWAGMQLQALPFTIDGGGQRAAIAWSSSGPHWVTVRRGMESVLAALAALLRPLSPPLPCPREDTPPDFLVLKYMCGEDGAASAQDVASCVLETCCLLPTFTGVRVTVVGQLLRGGNAVPEARPAAAASQHGSSSAGLGGSSSAGAPCFPTLDAAERACWEELVRQLSVRAPQLLSVEWKWQGGDGAACVPPAAWSHVASSGAPGAARYLHDLTTGTGASGSR